MTCSCWTCCRCLSCCSSNCALLVLCSTSSTRSIFSVHRPVGMCRFSRNRRRSFRIGIYFILPSSGSTNTILLYSFWTWKLGLCLGWYGQLIRDWWRRPSILQQPARDHVATVAKPVAASRLCCTVPVKQHKQFSKRFLNNFFNWVTTKIWHIVGIMVPDIHAKFHNQPFIMRQAIWRRLRTHRLTHAHTHN